MARSHGVIKVEVWEPRSDFRQLPMDAQWSFAMLISQPQINNLGVLPYLPEKWVRLAADLDDRRLQHALEQLDQNHFTITDRDTAEILVRTFIKHDKVWSQPKLVTNARRLIREVESTTIRDRLVDRHPWLVEPWTDDDVKAFETCGKHPSSKGVTEPLNEPLHEGVTEGLSPPRARVRAAPAPTPAPTPTASTARGQAATNPSPALPAAANNDHWNILQTDLQQAGWKPWQIERAAADPGRAETALARADVEADQNPGGYAWALFDSTDPLEQVSRRENGRRITGCRITRTGGHVYDPIGTDDPPQGWPHERPGQQEIAEARAAAGNGHQRSPLERALAVVPVTLWDYDPVALGHELDELGVTDPGERRLVGAAVEAERSARGVQVDERASA